MKRNKWLERFGFRYILNHTSKEIHRVSELKIMCRVHLMTNAGYHTKLSQFVARKFKGYDGCCKCNSKYHTK